MKVKLKKGKFDFIKLIAIIFALIGTISTEMNLNINEQMMQEKIIADQLIDFKYRGNFDYFEQYNSTEYQNSLNDLSDFSFILFRSATMNSFQSVMVKNLTENTISTNSSPVIAEIYFLAVDFDLFHTPTMKSIFQSDCIPENNESIYLNEKCFKTYDVSIGESIRHAAIDYNIYTDTPLIDENNNYLTYDVSSNLTIGGEIKVNTWEKFFQLFGVYEIWPYSQSYNLILLDIDVFYEEFYLPTGNIPELNQKLEINFQITKNDIIDNSYGEISKKLEHLENELLEKREYHLQNFKSLLLEKLDSYLSKTQLFRYLLIGISIPAFLVGIWFLSTIQKYIFQKDQNTLFIQRINGKSRKAIKNQYQVKAFMIGLVGGLLSYFLASLFGIFLQRFFLQYNYYNIGQTISFYQVPFNWKLLLFSVSCGIILSIYSTHIQLKKLLKNAQFLSISNDYEEFFFLKTNKKRFIGITTIMIILLIYSLFNIRYFRNTSNVLIGALSFYIYPVLSLLSLFIPYFIISAVLFAILNYSDKIFQFFGKLQLKFKASFENEFVLFKLRSKLKENFKLIFLISISFGFLFQVYVVRESYIGRENEMAIILNGDSDISFTFDSINLADQMEYNKLTKEMNEILNLTKFKEMIYLTEFATNFISSSSSSSCFFRGIEFDMWMTYFESLPNSWFSCDYKELFNKLQENNTILASKAYLETNGMEIGDKITLTASQGLNHPIESNFTIVGYYTRFPFSRYVSFEQSSSSVFYGNIESFPYNNSQTIIYGYRINDDIELNIEQEYLSILNYIDSLNITGTPFIDSTFSNQLTDDLVEVKYFEFLDLISYQFFIIMIGGILWILYVKIQNSKENWERILLQGGNKKFLFKISHLEYFGYLSISFLAAFLSIIGNVGLAGFLNDMEEVYPYTVLIPILKLCIMSLVFITVYMVGLIWIIRYNLKNLRTNKSHYKNENKR